MCNESERDKEKSCPMNYQRGKANRYAWLFGCWEFFSSSALIFKKADCALKTSIIKTREEG